MIINRRFFSVFLLLLTFTGVLSADIKEQLVLKRSLEYIDQYHYSPKKLDDQFSQQLFDLYLKRIDPNKQFLTQQDIAYLEADKKNLDDQLIKADPSFYSKASLLLKRRIEQVQSYYATFFDKPLDYSQKETIEIDPDNRGFAQNPDELKDRWRKIIKDNILTQYLTSAETDKAASKDLTVFVPRLEEEARIQVKKNFDTYFSNLLKETQEEQFAAYIDTISAVFDPHTGYFLPDKKEDFDISISGKLEGIGAVLKEEGDFIKVVKVVIGSAAWRQKDLKDDDIILKVAQGAGAPESVVGVRVRDAVKLIRGKKGSEVRLTVKKPDGTIKVVPIIRDIVHLEETYAKYTVIHHKTLGKKFGYIFLPGFYRDFEDEKGRNAATDVKIAIEELSKQPIAGIILDLRNNGGGSLRDAVEMTGLFIPNGPVVEVRDSNGVSNVLNDRDDQVQYKGPLVVMINAYSASASEILAAALQDYGRAVIVGAHTTYGKGTVQTFVDLDKSLPYPYQEYRPLGSLKLTIQNFYRINGGSTQFKGVTPDVIYPFPTDFRDIGEKELPNALPWTTVKRQSFSKWDAGLHQDVLRGNSEKRLKKVPAFKTYTDYAAFQKVRKDKQVESLVFKTRVENFLAAKAQENAVKAVEKDILDLIIPTPAFKEEGEKKKIEEEKFKEWKTTLVKDPYLNETIQVVSDLSGLSTKGK